MPSRRDVEYSQVPLTKGDEYHEPALSSDLEEYDHEDSLHLQRQNRRLKLGFYFYTAVVILYTIILISLAYGPQPSPRCTSKEVYSPANVVIEEEVYSFISDSGGGSSFDKEKEYTDGEPHVLGQNWDTLIDGALFVNITSDSSILPQLEFPSDPLPPPYNNTSIISLDVFHQLHCLDVLRRALREKPSEDSGIIWHQNHCVNSVRQALMCSADVTPISFYRDPETKDWNRYMPTFNVKHKCRNIEQIWKWANERHVPVEIVKNVR